MSNEGETPHARVLTEELIRKEAARNNLDILMVLGAALNPSMFADKVEIFEPNGQAKNDYRVFRIRESGAAYALHFNTILRHAIQLYIETGRKCEILAGATATVASEPTQTYIH